MNELIKELTERAGIQEDLVDHLKDEVEVLTYIARPQDIQKFAELIVRECIGVVEGGSFLHDQAPTAVFARECSAAIKRHFGVE